MKTCIAASERSAKAGSTGQKRKIMESIGDEITMRILIVIRHEIVLLGQLLRTKRSTTRHLDATVLSFLQLLDADAVAPVRGRIGVSGWFRI